MDIVLREADIIRLLGSAMELTLSPQDVTVHYKPLSVTIANAEQYLAKRENNLPRKDSTDRTIPGDAPLVDMDELALHNAQLSLTHPKTGPRAEDPVMKQRRLRANEMFEPPPPSAGEGEV